MACAKDFMMNETKKRSLSPGRQRLIDLCRKHQFCRIEGFALCDGEPILEPPPRVLLTHKCRENARPRDYFESWNYTLTKEVVSIFRKFDEIRNATVVSLTVQDGLPMQAVFDISTSLLQSGDRDQRTEGPQ